MQRIICDRSLLDLPKGIHQEVIRSMDIYLCLQTGRWQDGIDVRWHRRQDWVRSFSFERSSKISLIGRCINFYDAIHHALLRIQESTLHDCVIYSDSLSSLESIEQLYPTRHLLLNQIQDVIHNLAVYKNIAFVCGPSHSNIQGNETADNTAIAAINLQMPPDLKMNICDLKSKIKKESLATWQKQWEQTTSHVKY
jgi:ribonuclease HI